MTVTKHTNVKSLKVRSTCSLKLRYTIQVVGGTTLKLKYFELLFTVAGMSVWMFGYRIALHLVPKDILPQLSLPHEMYTIDSIIEGFILITPCAGS